MNGKKGVGNGGLLGFPSSPNNAEAERDMVRGRVTLDLSPSTKIFGNP